MYETTIMSIHAMTSQLNISRDGPSNYQGENGGGKENGGVGGGEGTFVANYTYTYKQALEIKLR